MDQNRLFRDVMGLFVTGVTLVTVRAGQSIRGMTANAFSSVSLDPPLVLVCVRRDSTTHRFIQQAGHFAVNILGADQRPLSERFAGNWRPEDGDPFADVPYRSERTGAPILGESLAYLDCRLVKAVPAGDHTVFIGNVEALGIQRSEEPALVFFRGRYASLTAGARSAPRPA